MTVEEVLAAAAKWEAAGNPDNAAKLRAYAKTLQPSAAPDAAAVEAKAAAWEAAGNAENAAKLRAYAATLPAAKAAPAAKPEVEAPAAPRAPDGAKAGDLVGVDKGADLAAFEAANPVLAGRYTFETLPREGDVVMGKGGGGKSGGARYTVQPWRNVKTDTFGDTAGEMMAGPIAAAKQFAGGLTGGQSPSRDFLANDPMTRNLPDFALTGLGAVGDLGGAALSTVGAGMAGAIGLGTEVIPGVNEEKLGNDLLGMAQFAVPELAGASSIPARMAAAAPRVTEAAAPVAAPSRMAGDVAAARSAGIPVLRTDVKPPSTFIGGVVQKTGEAIPVAGTGGMRSAQQEARVTAAQNFVREYGADSVAPAIDDVTASLLEKRGSDLRKYTTQKKEVITGLSDKGAVPVPKAVAAIDEQIAKLKKQKMAGLDPVIAKLEEFKTAIVDQKLTEIEANRAVIGEAFSGLDMGAIRGAGEKALSAVYGPLRDDMAAFIKANGGATALNKWGSANARLAEMAGELGNSALKRALSKGEASPETVRSMLFSAKPSDVKLLYKSLDEKGRASARTAIVQEALGKAGGLDDLANLSPDKFKNALGRLGGQVGVFFKGDDFAAADGLLRALKLTERAGKAGVAPLTGVQNLPAAVGILVSSFFGGSIPATVGAMGGIGGLARLYEATGVRGALKALAKAETPKAESTALQSLTQALEGAGVKAAPVVAAETANSNQRPDYEALIGRY